VIFTVAATLAVAQRAYARIKDKGRQHRARSGHDQSPAGDSAVRRRRAAEAQKSRCPSLAARSSDDTLRRFPRVPWRLAESPAGL